jgi:glycosyltransferase involved in cell wall biosynthesis
MRLLFVIDSLALGGAQKHVLQMVRTFARDGFTCRVVSLNSVVHPMYRRILAREGIPLDVFGPRRVASGVALAQLAWQCRRDQVDALVTVLFVSTIVGRLSAALTGTPVLTLLQARNVNYQLWQRLLVRLTSRLSHWTACNSREAAMWAVRHEGLVPSRWSFVPNGIQMPPFARGLDWNAISLPELAGARIIGSLGRLDRQKGYDFLIDALAPLLHRQPQLKLVLVGTGPERLSLEQQARHLMVSRQVVLLGEREDAVELLPGFSAYVQPSRFEGMPNAVMEAMAAGVPVIAAPTDGVMDLIVDGQTGWVVPLRATDWCRRIEDVLAAPDHARAIGSAGRSAMKELYSEESMMSAYRQLFDSVMPRWYQHRYSG